MVDVRTRELREALAERARLEEAERAARLRLGELERMGAISQLCAMIAHELKQPVGSVINYMAVLRMRLAQLAAGSSSDKASGNSTGKGLTPGSVPSTEATDAADPVLSRAVSGAEKEARRIAEIVDRVRAYAKREKRSSRPVDLYERLEAAVAGARRSRKGTIETECAAADASGHPIRVEGDPLELELLFLNLIKNALEASALTTDPAGPRVRVMLETGPKAPELTEAEVRVRVVDNGPRLSDEAFERLKRVSESVKADGLGLGLAIVRNIVDEHGARLALRRMPECGLEAAVTFDRFERFESIESSDLNTTTRYTHNPGDPS